MKIYILIIIIIIFNKNIHSSEIQILDEVKGTGIEIVNHSKVSVHYIGKLEDQSEFDNSYKRNEYFKFQVGTRQVIQGWEIGLLGMQVGGKRTIFIPYELAYGDNGVGNIIPPKSNLIFDIEVFEIIPPQYKELDSLQLKLAMTDDQFKIIDIRIIEEVKKSGIIPGSILSTAFDKQGNFIQKFLNDFQEIINPGDKVLFVSQNGQISSILANGFVEQLKQNNIYHLKIGIEGLKEINFEFEKIDSDYKIIKSTLDGSIQNQPTNIILYVTSNRRHLMPRDMIDNERSSAIHTDESVEEKISLSDRFGLWIGFHNLSQDDFIKIIEKYCEEFKLEYNQNTNKEAIRWSLQR